MPLEAATYISDLVSTNPDADDKVALGDDHIRLIKATLGLTFVNLAGEMRASHTNLNYLTGVSEDVQAKLDAISATLIVMSNAIGDATGNILGLAASIAQLNTDVGALEASVSALNTRAGTISAMAAANSASIADIRGTDLDDKRYTAFKMGGSATLWGQPSGWTAARTGSGDYVVTTDYSASLNENFIFVTCWGNGSYRANANHGLGNDINIYTRGTLGTAADIATNVMVVRNP